MSDETSSEGVTEADRELLAALSSESPDERREAFMSAVAGELRAVGFWPTMHVHDEVVFSFESREAASEAFNAATDQVIERVVRAFRAASPSGLTLTVSSDHFPIWR